MAEYIEREAFLDAIERMKPYHQDADDIAEMLQNFPAADVRPAVRGEWEKTEGFDEYGGGRYVEWTCSGCFCKAKGGWAVRDKHIDEPPAWNFCPNCGADMRSKEGG